MEIPSFMRERLKDERLKEGDVLTSSLDGLPVNQFTAQEFRELLVEFKKLQDHTHCSECKEVEPCRCL